MNKNDFQAQFAANLVASEIRRNGTNLFSRMEHLKDVYSREDFAMTELTDLLNPDWKSPEQIEAEREAAEAAAAVMANKPRRKAA
jgi:hypothetical protein